MSLKNTFNILILSSFVFVFYQSLLYYERLDRIPCFGLQARPENYALLKLIPFVGIMLLIPVLLILLKKVVLKRAKSN